jgi:hypothetical protein
MKRVAVLSLVLGCANTIAGSRGDAGDAGDVALEAAVPPTTLDITVVLWPRTPGVPAVGAFGRAEAEDGGFVEGTVGADGHLRLTLVPGQRYDVTLARAGYVALSLLGVRPPFQTTVRMQPQDASLRPADAAVRTRVVRYAGRRDPANRVVVEGGFSDTMHQPDRSELVVESWPGAPTLALTAIEFDGALGTRPLNAWRASDVSRDLDADLMVAFPARPQSPMTWASLLEFPSVGLVTGAMPIAVTRTLVMQRKYTASGDRPARVGAMQLETPTNRLPARMIVTAFDGALRPERVIGVLRVGPPIVGQSTYEVTVATRPPFAGLAIAVPPVQDLTTRFSAAGLTDTRGTRMTADTSGWHRAAFALSSGPDRGAALRWEGFAVDATPWRNRALPNLPSGVAIRSVLPTGTWEFRHTTQTCLLRDDPAAMEPPWSQAPVFETEADTSLGRSLLRVCHVTTP